MSRRIRNSDQINGIQIGIASRKEMKLIKLDDDSALILKNELYMLRAMTKPALMTFSNIESINFYFNAKLTDFAMFSYRFNIWHTHTHTHTHAHTYAHTHTHTHTHTHIYT